MRLSAMTAAYTQNSMVRLAWRTTRLVAAAMPPLPAAMKPARNEQPASPRAGGASGRENPKALTASSRPQGCRHETRPLSRPGPFRGWHLQARQTGARVCGRPAGTARHRWLHASAAGGHDTLRPQLEAADGPPLELANTKLLAPIDDPQKFLAIGMNYQAHADEAAAAGIPVPTSQLWFNKQVSCIACRRWRTAWR